MTTLTLTPDLHAGAVEIKVDNALGVTAIIRLDHNGARPVRLVAGMLPTGGALTVVDYEPALAGALEYRTLGVDAESAWTTLEAEQLPSFILPAMPHYAGRAQLVTAYDAGRPARSTFHDIIGRPDPAVAVAPHGTRTGTLDIWCETYQGARDLEAIIATGQTVLYRQAEHAGMDMYFHGGDTNISPDEDVFRLQVTYREVGNPPGNILAGPGWTFAGLAAAGGSFTQVANDYATFHDVAAGTP